VASFRLGPIGVRVCGATLAADVATLRALEEALMSWNGVAGLSQFAWVPGSVDALSLFFSPYFLCPDTSRAFFPYKIKGDS
jgi:energy-converting hydrogenase Eha subunit G